MFITLIVYRYKYILITYVNIMNEICVTIIKFVCYIKFYYNLIYFIIETLYLINFNCIINASNF